MKSILVQILWTTCLISCWIGLGLGEETTNGDKRNGTDSAINKIVKELVTGCQNKGVSEDEIRKEFGDCSKDVLREVMTMGDQFKSDGFESTARKICKTGTQLISCFTSTENKIHKCLDGEDKAVVGLFTKLCADDGAQLIGLKDGIECILNDPLVSMACAQKATIDLKSAKSAQENMCKMIGQIESCTMGGVELCKKNKEESKAAFTSFWSYVKADKGINEFTQTKGNCTLSD